MYHRPIWLKNYLDLGDQTMAQSHTAKAFDQELERLTNSICAMGDFAGKQFRDAVHALLHGDETLAFRVIDQDRQLDAMRRDLLASAALVIARRQPIASDLNEVLGDFKVVENLERIGDLAKNIAKRATAITSAAFPDDLVQSLVKLSSIASEQLRRALATFAAPNAEEAMAVRQHDEAIDRLHTEVFRELVSRMSTDQSQVVGYVHLLFSAKNIERIGDHATHIAEAAYWKATGHEPESERGRTDESSTFSGS